MTKTGDIRLRLWGPLRLSERMPAEFTNMWRRDLFPMGVRLLQRTLADILRGDLVMRPQDPVLATWEPSLTGAPRLFRPELPQLGMLPDGFRITE